MNKKILGVGVAGILAVCGTQAQMVVSDFNIQQTVDFSGYTAAGFSESPSSGQLSSTTWGFDGFAVQTGESNDDANNVNWSGTYTDGRHARGTQTGAFDGSTDFGFYQPSELGGSFGIKPNAHNYTPGNLYLLVQNNTGVNWGGFQVGYDLFGMHATGFQDVSVDFSYASSAALVNADSPTYSSSVFQDSTTGLDVDTSSYTEIRSSSSQQTISGINVANGDYLYLRWTIDDVSAGATGQRDQIAIDNVQFTAVPEPHEYALVAGIGLVLFALYRRRFATAA